MSLLAKQSLALAIYVCCCLVGEARPNDYSGTQCHSLNGTCQRNDFACDGGSYIDGLCLLPSTVATSGPPRPHSKVYHSCCMPEKCPENNPNSNSLEFGKRPFTGLPVGAQGIVGGNEAVAHSWPWQVSLRWTDNSHFCGGSIISNTWIVTAAHCLDGKVPKGIKVVSGAHNKLVNSSHDKEHAVLKFVEPVEDIALIKLACPIVFDEYRSAISLPKANEDFFDGYTCYITGWGLTKGTGDEDVLNELSVDVWNQTLCVNTWQPFAIDDGHICVGNGNTGACNGDSGGPLACMNTAGGDDTWVLAGASSFGISGCQTAGIPSVYTRITHYLPWLLNNTGTS